MRCPPGPMRHPSRSNYNGHHRRVCAFGPILCGLPAHLQTSGLACTRRRCSTLLMACMAQKCLRCLSKYTGVPAGGAPSSMTGLSLPNVRDCRVDGTACARPTAAVAATAQWAGAQLKPQPRDRSRLRAEVRRMTHRRVNRCTASRSPVDPAAPAPPRLHITARSAHTQH
jgi:hypothetical protein